MNNVFRLVKLCVGLCLAAILCLVSLEFSATAREKAAAPTSVSACQQFAVKNSNYFRISNAASAVVVADFNNDGIPDAALPMPNTNSVAVALGNNQTGFDDARYFIAGVSPQGITTGDFNRDGEIDLAITGTGDKTVNILLGDGAGNFFLANSYPVETAPGKVETADLNNDGWLDLVIGYTDSASNSLTVYLGSAAGFIPANPARIALGGRPLSFALRDFDRDGNMDLIATVGDTSVHLLKGSGQGGFTDVLTIPVAETFELASADFNGDNYPDFSTFSNRDGKLRVYLNNKSSGFDPQIEISAPFGSGVTAGDYNNDGKIDLNTGGIIFINDGNASFTSTGTSGVFGIPAADFNGDGIVDLISAGGLSDAYSGQPFSTFRVSYGLGNGKFEAAVSLPLGDSTSAVAADFNNDGRIDIASAANSYSGLRISFQNADGTFSLPTTAIFTNSGTPNSYTALAAGDFNNDGKIDLATYVQWSRTVIILINNGNGQFTLTPPNLNITGFSGSPTFIQTGDFNNDGKTDLVVVGGSYAVLLNDGTGRFTALPSVLLSSQLSFSTVAVGDFNADGKSDLAVTRSDMSKLFIYRGNGDGTFTNSGSFAVPGSPTMVRTADLNSDNLLPDLVVTTASNLNATAALIVLIANGTGGFSQTNYPLSPDPQDVTIGDFDGDSKKDFLVIDSPSNYITPFKGNGDGTFTVQEPLPTVYRGYTGAAADLNGDGKLDLLVASISRGVSVFYNETPKAPCLSVNDVRITEGDSGTTNARFTITLSQAATQNVAVDYRTVGRNARADSDFGSVNGKLEFALGTLTQTVSVPVSGDALDEPDETFQIVLSNPVNASLTDSIGVGTIVDDDEPPTVSISDASAVEGSGGDPAKLIFNVTLSSASGRKSKIKFTTLDGTAVGGSDYTAAAGTIIFYENETAKQIVINVNPDFLVESDETLKVRLSNPSNLKISKGEAVGTIVNDDTGGVVQFETTVIEAGETIEAVVVNVRRTGGNAAGVSVDYTTANGTATANQDYLLSSGKLVFGANESLKTFIVPILDDAINETLFETVNLTLANITGGAVLGQQSTAVINIKDNDPLPQLTIDGTSVREGNSGTTAAVFTVRLLAVSGQTISVNFATADGTANAPDDYQSVSSTLTFAPGETGKTISVPVRGDTQIEPNETFFVNLTAPVNVILQKNQAVGTIINDDSNSRRAKGDYDGDGKTDIAVYRPTGGNWFYLQSSDNGFKSQQFGTSNDRITPGDYDGDGRTDFAVYRPSSGTWYILRSSDNSFSGVQFGDSSDKPAVADFDGDDKTDVAVYRPSNGTWYVLRSSDNGFSGVQFGTSEDKPVAADYDGDGKADIAVFRPSNGFWYQLNSSTNEFVGFQFGTSEDKPVAADYDGDGKADIAVFRPSNGFWYLRQSTAGFTGVQWGAGGDQPAPGDYDGDGKTDIAVFRPTNGVWYLNRSTAGQTAAAFGMNGDVAVPFGHLPD